MPQKNSFAICLFSAVVTSAAAAPPPLDVMPAPATAVAGEGRVGASGALDISTAGAQGPRLGAALDRAKRRWLLHGDPAASPAPSVKLLVDCGATAAPVTGENEDESYSLEIDPSGAVLKAATDIGALRGLETFLQLQQRDGAGWFLPVVAIRDQPRFPWRGLMIDVARHWQPIDVIERNLDAMAAVKLNVLHLHLTDDQGFRIESLTHPELQDKGSDGHFFTQAQIRLLIAYADDRGIRVVPEFDIPGHATSWVVSHPELASRPGPYGIERQWGVFNPVLDPTNEATYALLADVLGEMASLFPDRFFHIGGDENNGVQWNANPRIQAFIRDHGLKDNAGLHAFFNQRVAAILKAHGKRLVGWDEIMNPSLPRDCVIDSWRGTEALGAAAALGFDGILANGYYIDLCYPAADHYLSDPVPAASNLSPAEKAHILGGEATMWSEWVTPETIDSRIWPRTAAIAERLWSPPSVRDVPGMYRRLAIVSERLSEAGALHIKNRPLMLRHLVGENLGMPGITSLERLISLIEPVKHYERGGLQVWSNQLMPLVGLADAAAPESEASRLFAATVDRMLFTHGGIDRASAASIEDELVAWGVAAKDVAGLSATYPAVREALPAAHAMAQASLLGGEAVKALTTGTPLDHAQGDAALAALADAALPNGSATELPALRSVRLLVAAAARQGARAGLADDAWRTLVTSSALPKPPSVPSP
jgi:hexosaminidase